MIVCVAHNQITSPECAEEVVENISRSALAIVGDCAHMSTMEKPGQERFALFIDHMVQARLRKKICIS